MKRVCHSLPMIVCISGALALLTSASSVAAVEAIRPASFFTNSQKIVAGDVKSFDNFGNSVAIHGDTAVVGAFRADDEAGSAYVYVRSNGSWTLQQELVPADAAAGDLFGRSVAISGDTVLVSALADDDNGTDSGSAYVFVRQDGSWTEQQKLLPSDGATGDQAGWSVALSGETAIVGVWLDDDNGAESGSAYVFVRNGQSWTEQQKIVPTDGGLDQRFGISVAIDGDTTVISAMVDDDLGPESGSAYVYVRNVDTWSLQQKLLASDGAAFDRYGISVSISGETVLVGNWRDDDDGFNSGSTYVYVRSGQSWTEDQKIVADDAAAGEEFGYAVDISGDTALIGAFSDDDNGAISGSAYVFRRSGGLWTQAQKLLPSDGAAGDEFGVSVAVDGDFGVSGSWWNDSLYGNAGAAYFYSTRPVCDVEMSMPSYSTGDTVSTEHFKFLVSESAPVQVEWKAWLEVPVIPDLSVVNQGADGSFALAAGADLDLGSVALFPVAPTVPRGAFSFVCRLMDPVTGETHSLDRSPFEVQ